MQCIPRFRQARDRAPRFIVLAAVTALLATPDSVPAQDFPRLIDFKPAVERNRGGILAQLSKEPDTDIDIDFDDEIRTGPRAWAAIVLGPDAILDIGSDTTTVIRKEAAQPRLELLTGRLIVALARAFRGVLNIRTPGVTLGIRGTLVEVIVFDDRSVRVRVIEGEVTFEGLDLTLLQGNEVLINSRGEPLPPSPISPWDPSILLQGPEDAEPTDPRVLDQLSPRLFVRNR